MEKTGEKKIRRFLAGCFLICLCAGFPSPVLQTRALANGNTAVASKDEVPRDGERERQARLEAERAARERRAAEARRRAAAAKAAAAKKAAVKSPSANPAPPARDGWMAGRNLVEEGRFQTALQYLRRFVNANPRSTDGWYWLSRAHHAMGDYDRAQWAANIVLEIDPYYAALTKTPSGLQPLPKPTKESKKEPRPSMSVLPVKQPVPSRLALEPTTLSFPYLEPSSGDKPTPEEEEAARMMAQLDPDWMPTDAEEEAAYREARLRYEAYPPLPRGRTVAWMQSEKFTEISRWRFRVDRMGILDEPRVPVAWKGERPHEVYFWTGSEWARIQSRNDPNRTARAERIEELLLRAGEDMKTVLAQRGYVWRESDTPSLASNAMAMRYWWQGDIDLSEARQRAEEREEREAASRGTAVADEEWE